MDLDGNGMKEILACGANNAYRAGALFVLDPHVMNGYSPTRDTYVPAEIPRATERGYWLFPRTIVGQHFLDRSGTNPALTLEVWPDERQLAVTVNDAAELDPERGKPVMASIKYTFSYALELQGIGSLNDYDRLAEKLVKSGAIPFLPDAAYFARFASEVMRWEGDHFERLHVLNTTFLK